MSKVMEYVDTFSQDKNTKKYERVACYIRVSTQEQKLHGISLSAQRDKLKEYAKKHNLKIVEWYEDEGVSGRKLIKNRPELQRMIKDAQAKKFDRIIFIKLDRFFRSVAEYHECMKIIDPVLWTATEEKYDLTTANGRAFVNMKITIAELEADQTGERIKIVNEFKVKTGQALSGGQNQGIAYTVQKIDGIKRVVPDPATKEMVIDYINYFLTHQAKRQAYLYVKNKYDTPYNYNAFSRLLKDTKLYGTYRDNTEYCESYIDKDTFDKIQYILNGFNVKSTPTKRAYLFSSLIKCPVCNCAMTGKCTTSGYNGKTYYSYRCNNAYTQSKCTLRRTTSEIELETFLLDNFDQFITEYITTVNVTDNREDSNTEIISKRIKEVKTEMSNSVKSFNKGRMTEADHDKEYAELEAELKELEAQLEPVKERDLTIYNDVLNSGWRELYEALTRENKRAFWRKYIKGIEIDENAKPVRPIFF